MTTDEIATGEMTTDELDLSPCERYFWRSHPLSQRSGSAIFAALFQPQTCQSGPAGIATLLESPRSSTSALARYSLCAGAPRLVAQRYQLWTPEVGQILPFLKRLAQISPCVEPVEGTTAYPPADLPFLGGWLGWLGYDLAWEIERLPWLKEDALPFPVAFWYEPAEFALLDHQAQTLWLAADTVAGITRLFDRVNAMGSDDNANNGEIPSIYIDKKSIDENENCASDNPWLSEQLTLGTDRAAFEAAVVRAKSHIRAGDVFQVNHSLRFQTQTTLPGWEIYQALHAINPSPFASYWHTPWGQVVSCSPERLVHLHDRLAQSRPIAGTRPRGSTPTGDAANAAELIGDRKEQAEHIMLVDLERNDLGRVCQWGSVQVDELMTIERYSHVMHLVSNVVGQLHPEADLADLIAALFPGGTITGCPKVRCMEIIELLEPVRRSLFYGSCGYIDRRGRLDLNILIRTLLVQPDVEDVSKSTVWGQVGAGIVADSEPTREWQESLQKAKAQLLALGLFEVNDLAGDLSTSV